MWTYNVLKRRPFAALQTLVPLDSVVLAVGSPTPDPDEAS